MYHCYYIIFIVQNVNKYFKILLETSMCVPALMHLYFQHDLHVNMSFGFVASKMVHCAYKIFTPPLNNCRNI